MKTANIRPAPALHSKNLPAWSWALPALIILLLQISLYLWMAPRGFEFTDEAYYFQNYLYWREFTGTVTFFGAYFEWPFRAMGMSIGGIRILSMVMVLACGAVLMHAILGFCEGEQKFIGRVADARKFHSGWNLIAPMASAMMYFGYLATLRAPSYNLLSLFTIAICTSCMLRTLARQTAGLSMGAAPLVYGLALGACFLSKATTSVIMVLGHAIFFALINRIWDWRRLLKMIAFVLAGFAVNFFILTLEFGGWLDSLREGIGIMGTRSNYGIGQMLLSLRWDFQNALERTGLLLIIAASLVFFFRRKLIAGGPAAISWITLAFIAAAALGMVFEQQTKLWLVGMAAASAALWYLERVGRPIGRMSRADRSELALMGLLFYLPLSFSFGSNMSVFGHSAMASMFVFCAVYLRLYSLAHLGKLTRPALGLATSLLCMPALFAQALALTDPSYTYRQLSGMNQQTIAVKVGAPASRLWVDAVANSSLRNIANMVATAQFKPGSYILDLTGDGPGFIYAVGARPLATPWMLGGYPGSDAAAARIISAVSQNALRGAWLLTSADNPLRVKGWEAMLAQRIGPGTHELIASTSITNPYAFTPTSPKTISLQLWRPTKPAVGP